MPIDTDIKKAYHLLYDQKDPEKALELYDKILKQSQDNLAAHIYKAASLEKLYYTDKNWHNQKTLHDAQILLEKALSISEKRGDRSKIGLVNFRMFIYYFNKNDYLTAEIYFDRAKELEYKDDTLPIWEMNLLKKLKKVKRETKTGDTENTENSSSICILDKFQNPTFKVDWYQSLNTVNISLFMSDVPRSKEEIQVQINGKTLEISYPIGANESNFYYSTELSGEVESEKYTISIFSKKIDIGLFKKSKMHWKKLESGGAEKNAINVSSDNSNAGAYPIISPYSSKKQIDWSKLDDSDKDDEHQSADSFFQNLYSNADSDTRRAMMKSFIESNGTTLNTNWDEVKRGKIEPALPDGVEMKKY